MRTSGRQPGRAPMTAFSQLRQADGTVVEFAPSDAPAAATGSRLRRSSTILPSRRPRTRAAIAAIAALWVTRTIVRSSSPLSSRSVLVPLILAATFGGLRVYGSATQASGLRLAADRAELIPDIDRYLAAMESVILPATESGDSRAAMSDFDARHSDLQQRLDSIDATPDVKSAVESLLGKGQELIGAVTSGTVDLRQRIIAYAPLLLTGESAITGSVSTNDHAVQVQAEGLARAVGARGQMAIQQMMVNRGGDEPEPQLRTSMITMAGTEPSTVTALGKLLGDAVQPRGAARRQL